MRNPPTIPDIDWAVKPVIFLQDFELVVRDGELEPVASGGGAGFPRAPARKLEFQLVNRSPRHKLTYQKRHQCNPHKRRHHQKETTHDIIPERLSAGEFHDKISFFALFMNQYMARHDSFFKGQYSFIPIDHYKQ
jgi:hypothetical protein